MLSKQSGVIHSLFFERSIMDAIKAIDQLITPIIIQEGLTLVQTEMVLEHGEKYLRIQLAKPSGPIELNDLVKMTQLISPVLDNSGLIQEHYILDITSAGIESPIDLKDLETYIDRYIHLQFVKPIDEELGLDGTLLDVSDDTVTLEVRRKTRRVSVIIAKENIKKARLAIRI
jgi:ribosome maturation factor RimP